jgi:hypothetical protein
MNPRDLDAQLAPVTRLRQRDMAHAIFEVEVWVIHPVRHMHTAGQFS